MTPERLAALTNMAGRDLSEVEVAELDACIDDTYGAERRDDVTITAILGRLRAPVRSARLVGEGAISDCLGYPAGPVFIRALRVMAEAPMPEDATGEQAALKSGVEEVWRHLQRGDLDINRDAVRAGLDALVGILPLIQEQADAIKSLALRPDPLPMSAVSHELNIAEGRMV